MTGEDNVLKLVAGDEAAQDGYRLQEQIGFVLRRAHQRHVAIFGSHIADLTPPQFAALAKLYDIGVTSQNQLGSTVAMDAATIKGVIERLKGRGLVDVEKHESDKRRLMVMLTQQGRDTVERLVPIAREITAKTLSPLSAKDAATLVKLLSKIV